jgi:hypothetical protein
MKVWCCLGLTSKLTVDREYSWRTGCGTNLVSCLTFILSAILVPHRRPFQFATKAIRQRGVLCTARWNDSVNEIQFQRT